jgi:hypothetical protein
MGSTCLCFWFVRCAIESHTAISEGIFIGHYFVQFRSYKINYVGSFSFYNQKDNGGNVQVIKNKP